MHRSRRPPCCSTAVLWLGLALAADVAAGAELTIARAWPQKLLCSPGETQTVTVTVANPGAQDAEAALDVRLVSGMDDQQVLLEKAIRVPAGATTEIPMPFPAEGRRRGWEVRARLQRDGQVLSEGRDYFVVSNEPWSVAHYDSVIWSYGLNADFTICRFRRSYSCMAEQFGQGAAYIGSLIPRRQEWVSNCGFRESLPTIREVTRKAHEQGIRITAYIFPCDFGPDGFEFARQHPEWVRRNLDGSWAADYQVALLDKLEDDGFRYRTRGEYDTPGSDKQPMWYPIEWDWQDPDLARHHADEVVRALREAGYDGVRYDGWMQSAACPDAHGRMPDKALSKDAVGARNHRLMEERVRAAFPNVLIGHNYGVRFGADRAEGAPTEENLAMWRTACGKGNYMLFEETVALWEPNHVFHDWEYYRRTVKEQSYYVLDYGGIYYIHLCRAGIIRSPLAYEYQAATALASRAHLSAVSEVANEAYAGVGVSRVNAFALRFADQVFDRALRDLPEKAMGVAVADDRLWWREYVYSRPTENGEEWVIHLINPPVSNTPDPKLATAPDPRPNVRVTVTPPTGKSLAQAWMLTPDGEAFATSLPVQDNAVTLPEVKVWSVLCLQWR